MNNNLKKQWQSKLNRRFLDNFLSEKEIEILKNEKLVVIYGDLYNCIQIKGAINDEIFYNSNKIYLNGNTILKNQCENPICPYFEFKKKQCQYISIIYNQKYIWLFTTHIEHEIIDIMQGNRVFCKGIIFDLNSI